MQNSSQITEASMVRSGRHGPRSKTGCSTCRIRKVKCDEQQPTCLKCSRAGIHCEWNLPTPVRRQIIHRDVQRSPSRILLLPLESATPSPDGETKDSDNEASVSSTPTSLSMNSSDSTSLPMSVALENIEMSNSLVLTSQDLRAFQYVPESLMVLRFGKPWRWSMLSYLHAKVAPQESGVMSAFIAVASMELRFRDLVQAAGTVVADTTAQRAAYLRNLAVKHFHTAIQQLCVLLDHLSRRDPTPAELQALFSMWFLILHCELYDRDLIKASQMHLNGIRSFIARYLTGEDGITARDLPPAVQQLLLFITYLDVNLALGNLNGGQLCLDLLSIPRASPLYYDRVWEASRVCLPKLWGVEYPPEEILDDVENYRGLSFLQAGQKLKLDVWQLAVAAGSGEDVSESKSRVWDRIEETGREYLDLLFLASTIQSSGGRRVVFTVYHGCLDFYALKVLYSCLDRDDPSPPWLDRTLADLLDVAHKALGEDPQQLYRISWPLAVALLKVRDRIHRDWVEAQLARAKVLLSDVGLPARLLEGPGPPENVLLEYCQVRTVKAV